MSEIINCLSEKASKVAEGTKNTYEKLKDYVQTGLESAKETIQENAKNIGKAAVRTGATVLAAAMIAGGLTGCGVVEQIINGIESDTTFPTPELKDYDEIIEDGITTKDVMDKLDVVATKIMHNAYKDIHGFDPKLMTVKFVEIRPTQCAKDLNGDGLSDIRETSPFYHRNESYNVDQDSDLTDVYEAELVTQISIRGQVETSTYDILISVKEFEELAKALGLECFIADTKYHKEHNIISSTSSYNAEAYEGFVINESTVSNWPDAAKLIMWKLSDSSLTSLTIDEKEPTNQID